MMGGMHTNSYCLFGQAGVSQSRGNIHIQEDAHRHEGSHLTAQRGALEYWWYAMISHVKLAACTAEEQENDHMSARQAGDSGSRCNRQL